jgi:hypothetical protein
VKFADFELITRSKSVAAINTSNDRAGLALELLRQLNAAEEVDPFARDFRFGVRPTGRARRRSAVADAGWLGRARISERCLLIGVEQILL